MITEGLPWAMRSRGKSLERLIEHDKAVAKRGIPSLPRLKFMEGLGPDDPKYAESRAA